MQTNTQAIEKKDYREDGLLEVHSIFPTIQGEGPFAGTPAVFVRLAGCNLQCPFCDTDYTSNRTLMQPSEIIQQIKKAGDQKLIVITGGEPFRQNLSLLTHMLFCRDYNIQIETNGAMFDRDFDFDYATIVCSPKTESIHPNMHKAIDAYKYVLHYKHICPQDGLPTSVLENGKRVARPHNYGAEVYVQPMDEQDEGLNKLHLAATVASALKYNYRLCLQIHKIIGLD